MINEARIPAAGRMPTRIRRDYSNEFGLQSLTERRV